ncbi:MAG: redox-sensing transcriptional repressor Rex [Bacteroidota bacterium]|nr:redox-sensing transcriptional repressor Rex [Bacteroidota bacterium]MDP4227371.1 redox-sensing transcriptional repressor Rex [Bacteroidota bacterium]MDP4275787.1 redox-sensing transcriptional repressor Rex [Bacteroidota bacterium]
MRLPERTVERLSQYRRSLLICLSQGQTHIYSHELAELHNLTAVQVRRDMMFIGYSSFQRKGYDIKELIEVIGNVIDSEEVLKVGVVGVGNMGKAITGYFNNKRAKLKIVAGFDVDPSKIGKVISGVLCYSFDQLSKIVKEKDISVGIITVPPEKANEAAKSLVAAEIKGILNFTTVPLNVSPDVYLEEYDMITSLEKVAYFVKSQKEK